MDKDNSDNQAQPVVKYSSKLESLKQAGVLMFDALLVVDEYGNIVFASEELHRMFGYEAFELDGKSLSILVPGSVRPHHDQLMSDYSQSPKRRPMGSGLRLHGQRKDGTLLPVTISLSPFGEEDGTSYVVCVVRDLSSRLEAEQLKVEEAQQELAKQNSILQAISDIQSGFIFTANPSTEFDKLLEILLLTTKSEYGFVGRIMYPADSPPYLHTFAITNIAWNEETRRFYDEHAPVGMDFYNLKTLFGNSIVTKQPVFANSPSDDPRAGGLPEGHPPMHAYMGVPLLNGTEMVGMIGLANRPGGYSQSYLATLDPLIKAVTNIVVAFVKETERQEAEKRLDQTRQELASFFDSANDLIVSFLPDGRMLYVNRAWRATLGYTEEEILSLNFLDAIAPDFVARFRTRCDQLVQGTLSRARVQTEFKSKAGQHVPVEGDLTVRREDGQVTSVDGIFRDVTERKIYERRILERTMEVEAANLQLSRALRTRAEFMATMSHELRTPLNAILGLCQSLQYGVYGQLSEKALARVNVIENSGQSLLELVNDILDMSMLQAGKMEAAFTPVSVDTLVHKALESVASTAGSKGILMDTSVPKYLPAIHADERQLLKILGSLLSNAVKFSPQGSRIGIAAAYDPHGNLLLLEVTDEGVGVKAEDISRIFRPFMQLDRELSRQHEGAGLGLSLALKLVELYGGGIEVDSEEGKGSKFTVKLPIDVRKTGLIHDYSGRGQEPSAIRSVMIVDSSHAGSDALTALVVEEFRVPPKVFYSGAAAMEHFQQRAPELMFLDLALPDQSGLKLLAELKRNPTVYSTRVVVTSDTDLKSIALELGADGFLTKPVQRQAFIDELKGVLEEMTVAVGQDKGTSRSRILVIRDQVQSGFEHFLEESFKVLQASSVPNAIELGLEFRPAVVIMHMSPNEWSATEIASLSEAVEGVKSKLIVLSSVMHPVECDQLLKAGAALCLAMPLQAEKLLESVRQLAAEGRDQLGHESLVTLGQVPPVRR